MGKTSLEMYLYSVGTIYNPIKREFQDSHNEKPTKDKIYAFCFRSMDAYALI